MTNAILSKRSGLYVPKMKYNCSAAGWFGSGSHVGRIMFLSVTHDYACATEFNYRLILTL
jgi:hypothetical protein